MCPVGSTRVAGSASAYSQRFIDSGSCAEPATVSRLVNAPTPGEYRRAPIAYRGVPRPGGLTSSLPRYLHAALPTAVPPTEPAATVPPQASYRVAEVTVDWSELSEPATEPRGSGRRKLYVEPEAAASRPPEASTAESSPRRHGRLRATAGILTGTCNSVPDPLIPGRLRTALARILREGARGWPWPVDRGRVDLAHGSFRDSGTTRNPHSGGTGAPVGRADGAAI